MIKIWKNSFSSSEEHEVYNELTMVRYNREIPIRNAHWFSDKLSKSSIEEKKPFKHSILVDTAHLNRQ